MSGFLEFIDIVIWPLVVVIGIAFLWSGRGKQFVRSVLRRTRSVKAFGIEVELEIGEEDARRLKADLEENFRGYRDEVIVEFDRQVRRFDVGRLLARLAEEVIEPVLGSKADGYRCTVYVEDIVFKNVLYRLLNYYPGGDGRGSTYSIRYGIIGRSWRHEQSEHPQKVPDDRDALINTWGMTREEAASQKSPKSYMTYLLREKSGDPAVGMLFIESPHEIPGELEAALRDADAAVSLTGAVSAVMVKMRGKGPHLELFDN